MPPIGWNSEPIAPDFHLRPPVLQRDCMRLLRPVCREEMTVIGFDQPPEAAIRLTNGEHIASSRGGAVEGADARKGSDTRRPALDPVVRLARRRRGGAVALQVGGLGGPAGG